MIVVDEKIASYAQQEEKETVEEKTSLTRYPAKNNATKKIYTKVNHRTTHSQEEENT